MGGDGTGMSSMSMQGGHTMPDGFWMRYGVNMGVPEGGIEWGRHRYVCDEQRPDTQMISGIS